MVRHLHTVALMLLLLAAAGNASGSGSGTRVSSMRPELVTNKGAPISIVDFGDDGTIKKQLEESGRLNLEALLPYDQQPDISRKKFFITTPLVRPGIPFSLSTLSSAVNDTGRSLLPYPSFDVHRTTVETVTDCKSQFVSVVTTTMTLTDRNILYALDSGVLSITTTPVNVCPPKICVFDLNTDTHINSTEITNPECNSLYTVIQVESCASGGLVAYTSDAMGFRLTVTDLITGISKHLQSQYFYPKPGFFFTRAGGPSTYLPYGLDALAVDGSCDGKLYLQAYASNIQDVLHKQTIRKAKDGDILDLTTEVALPGHLSGPSGPLAVDAAGERLFFPIQDELAIYCWNTSKPHRQSNFLIIAQDEERLQYISSLKIDPASNRLWILSNRFTKYLSNTLDFSETNFYLTYLDISTIVC